MTDTTATDTVNNGRQATSETTAERAEEKREGLSDAQVPPDGAGRQGNRTPPGRKPLFGT
jgi:hypothetical protein